MIIIVITIKRFKYCYRLKIKMVLMIIYFGIFYGANHDVPIKDNLKYLSSKLVTIISNF